MGQNETWTNFLPAERDEALTSLGITLNRIAKVALRLLASKLIYILSSIRSPFQSIQSEHDHVCLPTP